MTDAILTELAEASGVAARWKDFRDGWHDVAPDTLRAVLQALGVAAATDAEAKASLAEHAGASETLPPLLTAAQGEFRALSGRCTVLLEGGGTVESDGGVRIDQPGYHRLRCGQAEATLAVAPLQCHPLPPGRPWGIATQLYSLRRAGDGGIGGFSALADFVRAAGARGADAVAISPVHAQFSADPDRFSPYAPSSRIMRNVLHVDAGGDAALEAADFWSTGRTAPGLRLAQLRRRFDARIDEPQRWPAFRSELGEALESGTRGSRRCTSISTAATRRCGRGAAGRSGVSRSRQPRGGRLRRRASARDRLPRLAAIPGRCRARRGSGGGACGRHADRPDLRPRGRHR